LRVAEDGSVLQDDVNNRFLADLGQSRVGRSTRDSSNDALGADWASAAARGTLSGGSKVAFRELPSPVRETLRKYAGTSSIDDIDKGTVGGQTVYEAAFKHRGEHTELRVAEDGSLVKDDVNARFVRQFGRTAPPGAIGRPAGSEVRQGGEVENRLVNARKVSFEDLPAAVQTTLRREAGESGIENIERGTVAGGRAEYRATITREGQNIQLRVGEDGRLRARD
jgi:hypothetical protein